MVNQERLLALFRQLVAIDSPSYGERRICDFLKEKLSALGLAAQEDDAAGKIGGSCGNLYCYVDGAADLPPLLFSAHMDTVEPSRGKRAVTDADGVIRSAGDTVLGADDCAGLAAILEALTALRASGLPHRPLELLFSAAEEPYCRGVRQFDFAALRSREAYVFDLTGPVGGAAYQAPTILSFSAAFAGRPAHAGFAPEDGIHAIKAACLAASRIPCGRVGEATVNIGTVTGGTADNIVPDRCTLTGEIRSFSDAEAHARLDEVAAAARQAAGAFGASVELQTRVNCAAYRTDPAHPVVRRFAGACEALALPLRLCQTFGGSDQNYFSQHGVTGLVVATAMNNCHACDEYTTEQELVRAANLALRLMLSAD